MNPVPPHRRILVIHNPTAGRRREARFGRVLNALVAEGCLVEVLRTASRGDAEAFAHQARVGDWDVVAVAGGDGTINEVLNGLGDDAPPLAIVPLGTASVAACEIGMPRRPADIARVIARGPVAEVFVGTANGRRFIAMAGVGFDARVVAAVDLRLKRWIGRAAYVVAVLRELGRRPGDAYTVTVDGRSRSAAAVVLAKGRFYGGRFSCAPEARLDDPRLHVCLFEQSGRAAAVRYMAGLLLGTLPRMKGIAIIPATRVIIAGRDGEPVQGDGDIIARLPLEAGIAPGRVRVVIPGPAAAASSANPAAKPRRRPY